MDVPDVSERQMGGESDHKDSFSPQRGSLSTHHEMDVESTELNLMII